MTEQEFQTYTKERFTEQGWRVTAGVRNVVSTLAEIDRPLSAEEIRRQIQDSGKNIDLATVYRILDRLQQIKLVHKVVGKYMPTSDPLNEHEAEHFMLCEKTGKVHSIFLNYHDHIAQQLRKEKGFQLKRTEITFFGEMM